MNRFQSYLRGVAGALIGERPHSAASDPMGAREPVGVVMGPAGPSPARARERLGLIIVVFAVVALLGTIAAVALALNRMAGEVNRIEGTLTTRSAEAAVRTYVRRLGESNSDYARWDDAVHALYGTPDAEFVATNLVEATASATFFDTIFLLDEDDHDVFGYRFGEAVDVKSMEAFGPALKGMLARLPRDGRSYAVETGLTKTPWGLAAVAVGPVVPNTEDFADIPERARLLIIARAFDEAAVARLGEDFVIDGLRLGVGEDEAGLSLTDPAGAEIGRLVWSPPRLGRQAHAETNPTALALLAVLALATGALTVLAVRSLRRSNRLAESAEARQWQLNAALANMPHGLCMFDAESRLVLCNSRYAELYKLPPHLVRPGTALADIVAYRERIGNAPIDFPNYINHEGIEFTVGTNTVFEFALQDGRTIRLNHLSLLDGGYVATHEDVSETARVKKRMSHMAKHDALTNLPNRVLFRERLHEAFEMTPNGGRFAVHCLDLDRFKSVNDTLGHPIGDALLIELAERLKGCVRASDTVARLSGDEFAIIQLGVSDPSGAVELAERIIREANAPYELHGQQVVISVSIGVAVAPEDGGDPDEILKHAGLALYRAKADGRSAYCFFEPIMNAKVQTRRLLEVGLRRALAHGELELHYQPIFALKDNRPTGFEALLRWRDPDRGLVQPAEFIPLAEETGLIVPIGEWAIRQACADAAKWPHGLRVAVNLSATQFHSKDLANTVFGALAQARLPADRLEIEVTESVLLVDSEATLATLHRLRDFGVHISMDDFGTGYSSLSYLRSFPFDKIKIDQSFVRDMSGSDDSLAIVRAVTGLGTALGMTITAEGVETQEQLEALRREGCTEGQGYLFSRPLSPGQLVAFFADARWFGSAPLARSA